MSPNILRDFCVWLKQFASHYGGGLYRRADEHHIFLIGGGLAFSIFVCIVPFVLIIFFVLSTVFTISSLENQIGLLVHTAVPYEPYAAFVEEILRSRTRELVAYKDIYGIVGGLGLLFAASGLFSSMRTILNTIYQVQIQKNEAVGKLRDFGMVLLVLGFFIVSITLLPILEAAKDATGTVPGLDFLKFDQIESWAYSIVSFLIVVGVFFVLYVFVPYGKMPSDVLLVSALWTALLWEIVAQAFGYYINNFASMERMYGIYSLLIVVIFWIYYASLAFIVGAEIGQLYRERKG
ncbi:MAG: YihY/virulence factor BrkB family protein [bacterium]|nr:YihY/virulence factor BrkB family protein [bacterium]